VPKSTTRSTIRNFWQSHSIQVVETVSCRSSASSPSFDKSQESLVFHDYPDLESSSGTLVYLPNWLQFWDLVSAQHPTREGWRAISPFRIWASSKGWGLRPANPDLTQARAISNCSNNQHPPIFIPCQGHQDGNWGRYLGYQHQERTPETTKEPKSWWSGSIWAARWTFLSKQPDLCTRRTYMPKDPERMPRQHPGRSLRNGMDSWTSVKELLVAQDEQAATRGCQVLWYMCSIQGSQASPIWTPTAPAKFLADPRDLLHWASSRTSLLSKPRTQYWLWLIISPKWPISPLVPSRSW